MYRPQRFILTYAFTNKQMEVQGYYQFMFQLSTKIITLNRIFITIYLINKQVHFKFIFQTFTFYYLTISLNTYIALEWNCIIPLSLNANES